MADQIENTEENKKAACRPPKRKTIGSNKLGSRVNYKERNKLNVEGRDPNYVYRIVNSDNDKYAGRIEKFQKMGYSVVNDEDVTIGDEHGVKASSIGSNVGTPVGRGVRGVLMRIPKEFYEEDQAMKQAEVDETEKGMVADELRDNANGLYGEGLKVATGGKTRMKVSVED